MTSSGFHRLSHGHQDLVLAVDYNLYGDRMVTASSDHRLSVRERDEQTSQWHLVDTWTAHDAEVTDVKWNGPFVGVHLASIGEDGFVRIWQEDVHEPTNSGRRFKKIFEKSTETSLPYMSLDLKNIGMGTYLAVITRDGFLSVFEPEEHHDLSVWQTLWAEQICKAPPRTEETGFRLSWHREKLPAWPAILAGLDRRTLSLAVAIGDVVKLFRTDKERTFYVAATLEGSKGLVRDVSWANGSMRGFDIMATASKDGYIRIYEVHTPGAASLSTSGQGYSNNVNPEPTTGQAKHPPRSGIGAGLANSGRGRQGDSATTPGMIKQDSKLVAEFEAHDGAPWRVGWSEMGDTLVSTGDDGFVRLWKKAIDGKWLEAADIDALK